MDALEGKWRPLLLTGYSLGPRASEIRGLRWSDVNIEGREVRVHQRADRFNQIGKPKSEAGERTVPIPLLAWNAHARGQAEGCRWNHLTEEIRPGAIDISKQSREGRISVKNNAARMSTITDTSWRVGSDRRDRQRRQSNIEGEIYRLPFAAAFLCIMVHQQTGRRRA